MKLMGFLRLDRWQQLPLFLDSPIAIELLADVRDLNLRRVLLKLVLQRLRLRESSPGEYVQYRCNCGRVVALHVVKVRELSWHVA